MTMSWCFADESTPATQGVLAELSRTHAETPALWPFEVANAVASGIARNRITPSEADVFLNRLAQLPIYAEERTHPIAPLDLMPLVLRYGLTAYDAAYLDLAVCRSYALATLDRHLIASAPKEGIRLMGQTA